MFGNSARLRRRAGVVAGLVAFGGLAALAGSSSPTHAATAPVPIVGDTLTVALQGGPNSMNPGTVDTAFTSYTTLAYDSLIYVKSDGTLQPDLATSWKYVGKGNKRFDLTLRKGVTFSDGSKLDAAGVKASLEYAKGAKGGQAQMLAPISSIDVTGPLSLSIKLSEPDPLLPLALTPTKGVGQIISPAALADPTKLTPANPSAGSGPYVYDPSQSTTGDHYTYLARQGYWDKSKQHFKKIVLRVIANPQAAVNALRTGQVDVVTGGDATTTQQVSDSGFRVTALPFVWQGLNLIDRDGFVSKPLGDVRVRQAINYAIDRKTVAKAVLGRYGVPTVETVVRGGDGWSAKDAKMYAYNPAKAKQLLTAAGYPDGFTLPVMSIVFAGIDTMAQAVAGELAKVGITVKLTSSTDVGTYIGGLTKQQYPAVAVGYGAQPMYLMGTGLFLPVAPLFNGFHTSRAKLSDLYTKAAAADDDQRAKLDTQMQEYLVENAWFAPVAFSPVFYFSNTKIKGVKVSANAPTASPLDWYLIK